MNGDAFSRKYWSRAWSRVRRSSFLYRSQQNSPHLWQTFYNTVGDVWQEMSGDGQRLLAEKIVAFLIREQLVKPDDTFIDVGCGPGSLSLAFAEQGLSVIALDASEKMVAITRAAAERRGMSNLIAIESDWLSYRPERPGHLVLAASFPQAVNPKGIRHLERLATRCCGLLLGCGKDILPFRQRLWDELMDTPLQTTHSHLACAINYLLASGRNASLHRFEVPVRLNLSAASAIRFYENYFAIFGKAGPEVAAHIEAAVSPFASDGCLDFTGTLSLALIYWSPAKSR